MGTQTDTKLDRRRRQVAASYRKQGYRVFTPSTSDGPPAFLHDCHPDLIAEKEGDHVVIEVKASRALKGANELIELADRVAAQPGWRLELVAVRTDREDTEVLSPDWLEQMLRSPAPGTEIERHCIYLGEVLAYLIKGIASVNHIRTRDKTTLHIARELVYAGVLDQTSLDRVEDALEWQDDLMRQVPMSQPAAEQEAAIVSLCRDIHTLARSIGA